MPMLEQLESRNLLSAFTPTVAIVGVGLDANEFTPMVNVMLGANADLLNNAGYNVQHGSVGAVVNLPSNGGALTETQLVQQIGPRLPAGVNMAIVFLDDYPTSAPADAAAWHDGFTWHGREILSTWTPLQQWVSIPAFHEFDEATADAAGAKTEICDPVNWQAEPLGGFNVSNFVKPDGAADFSPQGYIGSPWQIGPVLPPPVPPMPAPVPKTADMFALGIERIEEDLFGLLSRVDPFFAEAADSAAAEVAVNPWAGTPQGNHIEQEADMVFASWLAS